MSLMLMKNIILLIIVLLPIVGVFSQNIDSTEQGNHQYLLVDGKTGVPLPYANILFVKQQQGTISNEAGFFSITTDLLPADSVFIQYLGYKTLKTNVSALSQHDTVNMEEELVNLSEAWVYGNPPKAKDIIEKIVINRAKNYQPYGASGQVFIRNKQNSDFDNFTAKVVENSIEEIDSKMLNQIVAKIPRHTTSFTDFLGTVFSHPLSFDSVKISPRKTVMLKEEEFTEMEQLGKIFEKMFSETKAEEYWKIKSGLFSKKLEMGKNITVDTNSAAERETNKISTESIVNQLKTSLKYASLADKEIWEFLYKPGRYKYNLAGGTRYDGEDIYIIYFWPRGGKFEGRIYVSTSTYALLKADFQYGDGKDGKDVQLLNVGYHEKIYRTSISWERIDNNYQLKYFSNTQTTETSFERNISLLKKRDRFMIDKTLNELEVKVAIKVETEETKELLVLSSKKIESQQYLSTTSIKEMPVVYVNQYSDDIWQGQSVMEPTSRMHEYQKQEINWDEPEKK